MSENKPPMPKISMEDLQKLLAMKQGAQNMQPQTKIQTTKQKLLSNIMQKMERLTHYLDRFVNFITKSEDQDRNQVVQAARMPIMFGVYVVIIFIGCGGLWTAFAPLDSAAGASGTVISSSNRKIIQHPEGGIIKSILVKQGEEVKEGQPLVELEETRFKTTYEATLNQYRTALATESRLIAERDDLDHIVFPEFLIKDSNILEVEKIMHTQENLFKSRKEFFRGQNQSARKKIEQYNKQIEGLHARRTATAKNLEIYTDRLKAITSLVKKGFAQKSTVLEMEAREASLKGELAGIEAEIVRTEQEITKTEIEIINFQNQFLSEVLRELKETQVAVGELRERFSAAKDALERVVIKSPVDGIINVLNYHTIGGVISPAQPVAEITPSKDVLIIEARVPSRNIDSVHVGLVAKLRFNAFKSRTTPVFTGKVVSISPDIVQDRSGMGPPQEPVYIARIEIDMDEFNRIAKAKKLELHPGMQAEVQIVTGTRTLLRYLLDPILDTMFRSFKER